MELAIYVVLQEDYIGRVYLIKCQKIVGIISNKITNNITVILKYI